MTAPCPILGFTLSLTFDFDVAAAARDAMVDDLIDSLARHGLRVTRDGDRAIEWPIVAKTSRFAVRRDGSQATDADRALVREWADRWTPFVSVEVSDVMDLGRSD
jgi:uncharacterized protein YggL (DUF469 family)